MARALVLSCAISIAGCGTPPSAPASSPLPAAPVAPASEPPLEIDPLPGSLAELEAIAADPASAERGALALEKMAAILHATGQEVAAAQALRRLYVRPADAPRTRVLGARLAMALDAAAAPEEADALRRHLVCPSLYSYAPGADGAPAHVSPLPQDHDRQYWETWEGAHPKPLDLGPKPKASAGDADTHLTALYTACPANASDAALWLALGRAHRVHDARGGPFAIPRAVQAYEHAVQAASSEPRGAMMLQAHLELGEALHAEERYQAATTALVRALTLCEDTGACARAEREEALALIADALTHLDFVGPPADAPVSPRPDVIDTEVRPGVSELKLREGLDRALDPTVVPKERAFSADVLAALAQLYVDLSMFRDAVLALSELRQRFPAHRDLPAVLEAVARVDGRAAFYLRPADAVPAWARAIAAWDEVVAFVSNGSAWRTANASDAPALDAATAVANEAPRELAIALARTCDALEAAARAKAPLPTDDATARGYFRRALDVWTALAAAADAAPKAEAHANVARIRAAEISWLARAAATIEPARWADARGAAVLARDEAAAGTARTSAAQTLVDLADTQVRYDEALFASTHGKQGVAPRDRVLHSPLRVRPQEELPASVAEAVKARDDFAAASPGTVWAAAEGLKAAAGMLFAHGHTKEAESRLGSSLALVCRTPGGMELFTLLAEMARAAKDDAELSRLAAMNANPSTTCARTPADVSRGKALTRP